MKNLYLIRVWKESKLLFVFVLGFIFFQLMFNLKRIHSFPWFVWDMYSRPETVEKVNSCFEIYADGQRIAYSDLPYWGEIGVYKTFRMYNWLKMNNFNDPMDVAVRNKAANLPGNVYPLLEKSINNHQQEAMLYPAWLHQYIEKRLGRKVHSIEVREVKYFRENNRYVPNGENYLLLQYPEKP